MFSLTSEEVTEELVTLQSFVFISEGYQQEEETVQES